MINHIEIPGEYVGLCRDWYCGIDDMLYAIASTGNLTTGNRRPTGCETDEQWYLQLYRDLEADIVSAERDARYNADDYKRDYTDESYADVILKLKEFREWVAARINELEAQYNLAGWEN